MFETQTLALVSHAVPPGQWGFTIMLHELLGEIPEERLGTVGIGGPWGRRAHVPLPVPRLPSRKSESAAMALVMAGARQLGPAALARLFPNVRRIFATLDPTLPLAATWARATGADLWVYAIDLHASSFWGAGAFMRGALARWRRQALGRASRVFAISPRMGTWMQAEGATAPIEVLPPLINVDSSQPAPLPAGQRSLLFCGWIYAAQARALGWLQRAVADLAPNIQLRLVTLMTPAQIAAAGLDPARWSAVSVPPDKVTDEVARATGTIVSLDPQAADRLPLQVAWPTKLREYLSVGRPVMCLAPEDYGITPIARDAGWGLVAADEAQARAAVAAFARATDAELQARARAAHQFARAQMNNRTIGAAFRAAALRP